jgi:hypothetical protein
MQTTGNEIRSLESELNALRAEDDTERAQIDKLSSHSYLERRLAEGFIQLTPITDDKIVRLHAGGEKKATAATTVTGKSPEDLATAANWTVAQ